MENIDNMAKNSLHSLSREELTGNEQHKIKNDIIRAAIALSCLAVGLVYAFIFPDNKVTPALFYTVGFLVEGIPVFVAAVKGILSKEFQNSMEMLVAIAIAACYCTGDLVMAILIPVILNVAHFLEERSIVGGREVIDGLRKMNHDKAILLENGEEKEVSAKSLKAGQHIVVKPGAGIPIDGVVVKGKTNVDQKSLTGEPQPEPVDIGSPVYAGTINLDGQIVVRIEKEYVDTSFSQILTLLEEAENISTPETRLVDQFMKYYIPFVLVVAVAVGLFTMEISKSIAILVVSCPCGQMLVSSAPMIAALSVAIKRGILIKNSKFIEELTEVDAVMFDKTGTITKGEFSLMEVLNAENVEREEVLRAALTVAAASTHPISRALCKCVETCDEAMEELTGHADYEVSEISGHGMQGVSSDGKNRILFGNRLFLENSGIAIPEEFACEMIGSVSFVSMNDNLLGALSFNDMEREEAGDCVAELKSLGAERLVVLTGDRKASAERICERVGIEDVRAELLPIDKLDAIKELKETNIVLAVGDGINDALALKEADVGIAMGAMGSDLAIQSADIALMNNNLENIPFAIKLAHQTKKVIYQNLALSCCVSLAMIIFSALGVINVLAGAILHNVGAFIVLLNSSRVLKTELWVDSYRTDAETKED